MADLEPLKDGERYRCKACGALTRFDVVKTTRTKSFYHFTIGGALNEEDVEVLAEAIETVTCRWCGHGKDIEVIDALEETETPTQ